MSGEQVPCKVCGQPAPKFGRYAYRCEDHREIVAEPKSANGAQPLSRELRALLLDLVLLEDLELDQVRLDAARILLAKEKP